MDDFVRTAEFRRGVFLNPEISGIVRSLLGENFMVLTMAHHHLYEGVHAGQTWHSDGLTETGYGVTHLQCYYYPQAVEIEDGPTMVLPGSQFRLVNREAIAHYRDILGQVSLTVPAGTVSADALWNLAQGGTEVQLPATQHDQVFVLSHDVAKARLAGGV